MRGKNGVLAAEQSGVTSRPKIHLTHWYHSHLNVFIFVDFTDTTLLFCAIKTILCTLIGYINYPTGHNLLMANQM